MAGNPAPATPLHISNINDPIVPTGPALEGDLVPWNPPTGGVGLPLNAIDQIAMAPNFAVVQRMTTYHLLELMAPLFVKTGDYMEIWKKDLAFLHELLVEAETLQGSSQQSFCMCIRQVILGNTGNVLTPSVRAGAPLDYDDAHTQLLRQGVPSAETRSVVILFLWYVFVRPNETTVSSEVRVVWDKALQQQAVPIPPTFGTYDPMQPTNAPQQQGAEVKNWFKNLHDKMQSDHQVLQELQTRTKLAEQHTTATVTPSNFQSHTEFGGASRKGDWGGKTWAGFHGAPSLARDQDRLDEAGDQPMWTDLQATRARY